MKVGLLLEGGAMRGLYSAGIIDTFLDNQIHIDTIIGVSAGALFGMNLKSRQNGRVLRYNTRFAGNRKYMGLYSLLSLIKIFVFVRSSMILILLIFKHIVKLPISFMQLSPILIPVRLNTIC